MKTRLMTLLIAFIALPTLAQAAGKPASAAAKQRAAILKTQVRGATVISNMQHYQILPGVRAAQAQPQEQPQQTLARVGGGKVVETKGPYVVFTSAQQGAGVTQVNGTTSYPTAYNSRTGGIGILPGTLNAKLKDMANAAAVGSDHGLELVREFARLKIVFYRVRAGQDVAAAAASLVADPRVASAEVEVIENIYVPN